MTYNVFIQDFSSYFLLALAEEDVAKVIEAHDTGAESVSIPGEPVTHLTHFKQIRIFENERGFTSQQITTALDHKAGRYGRRFWDVKVLEQLGREVTREKMKHGFGTQPRRGSLTTVVAGSNGAGMWDLLHPRLTEVSRKVFEVGSYKEAALNAFIELDERVGNRLANHPVGSKKTGKDRMLFALAEDSPIIKLFPDDNPDARMMQEGYKFIYAGVMLAIRNPKGHRNFSIEEQDAIELLFLASRLLRKLDDAVH